jgi:hypothetical protein
MNYLIDRWIWLCAGLGFGFAASCAIFTYWLGLCTVGPDCKMSLPGDDFAACVFGLYPCCDGVWLRVSSRQPCTFAFSIGVGSGIPLMFRVGRKLKARGVKFG